MNIEELYTSEHKTFLDDLRMTCRVNMFGASIYIQDEFGVNRREANEILRYWMDKANENN